MRYLLTVLSFFFTLCLSAQENYTVQIGDKSYSVGLDSSYQVEVQGKKMTLSLKQKDIFSFRDTLFSFSYPKGYQYSKTNIENIAEQYAIITAEGSGFMIQKYWTLNPTLLNDILLREVTKESIGYGYKEKKENYTRTLRSGQTIHITKDVLTYKDNVYTYEIASIGGKDEGIVVITIDMGLEQGAKARELVKVMWSSLTYNK